MQTPQAGYGYILIDTPEKKAKHARVKSGDEYWSVTFGHRWQPCSFPEMNFCENDIYRRHIDPGEGWELVPEYDIPNPVPNDGSIEHTFNGVDWTRTWNEGGNPGRPPGTFEAIAFRRRKTASKSEEWVEAKNAMPKNGQRVWFTVVKDGDVFLCNSFGWGMSTELWHKWRPVLPGEIPQPPKSREELAWEKFEQSAKMANHKDAFLAGIEWAKNH